MTASTPLKQPVADFSEAVKQGVFAKFDQDELIHETIEELFPKKDCGSAADPDCVSYTDEDREEKKKREFHRLLKWGFVYYPNDCADKSRAKKCVF